MKKIQKSALIAIMVIIVAIQFIPVERANPPISADLNAAQDVKKILHRSCYDCHSNQTSWPWYSYVAPVSWLIASDVHDGRRHLNFSQWETLSTQDRDKILEEIWEEIDEGEMPLGIYTLMHSRADLSEVDKKILYQWTHAINDSLQP